jgi:hypothetical protein
MPPHPNPNNTEGQDADNESSGDEVECTGWSGGVTHYISSDEEPIIVSDDDKEEEEEVEMLSGSELEETIQQHSERSGSTTTMEQPVTGTTEELTAAVKPLITELNTLSVIMGPRTNQDWKKAESTRSLGYNGQSGRMKRHHAKVARDKEMENAKLRKG